MKFKGTVALTTAFIGIVLYYFLIDVPTEERKREEKIRSEKVLPFDSDNVEIFSIIKEKNTIALKRSGADEWQMTKPVNAKGDSGAVSTFLSFISNLSFTRVVEESPKNLNTFGLDTPVIKITLSTKEGETKGIRVGDNHPMGNKLYLARLNENRVLTADITKDRLDKRTYDLRDKTILSFDISKVKKIEYTRNGEILVLKKLENSWQLSEGGVTAKGDANKIINLLNTIQTERIKEFIDEQPEQLTPYGLNNPKHTLKLTEQDINKSIILSIGKKVDNGFYAKAFSENNVFLINQSLFDTINNSRLVNFMDKSLVDFETEELTNITLRMGGEIVQLIRDKKDLHRWTIEKPFTTNANTATVNSLLFDLKGARIVKFLSAPVTNKKIHGLHHPKNEITLTYTNGKTWALTLGNQTQNADHYFARRTDEKVVFTLKKSDVETIFRPLHDLRDRTLLEFNSDEVQEIKIRNPEQTFVLKKSTNKWKLTQPESIDSVQGFIGNDILWTLNSLEFEATLSKDPGNELTGLNQPLLSVELLNKKSMILAHVVVGKPVAKSPELHYLKIGESPTVHTVKKRILNEIPSNIKKFNGQDPSE